MGLDFHVIWDNLTYFFIGRYPHGPLGGVGLTFYLAVVSCILSFFGGLILGLLAISRNRLIRYASEAIIQFVRGMPLIMVIFWMYFLYPGLMGRPMPESQTVILALHRHTMLHIILPQALRNMIPSFVNQFVSLIKDTSLAFIVGVSELTMVATQINNRSLIYPTEIFLFIAVIYFIFCYAFTTLSRWLEKRLAWAKAI
jgi:polar amino acid transport system permease protein